LATTAKRCTNSIIGGPRGAGESGGSFARDQKVWLKGSRDVQRQTKSHGHSFRFLPWKCPFSFGERTPSTDDFTGEKTFSRSSPKAVSLSSFAKANSGSLKITPLSCPAHARFTSNPRTSFGQECRLRLKRPTPNAARRCPPTSEVVRQMEEEAEFFFARVLR